MSQLDAAPAIDSPIGPPSLRRLVAIAAPMILSQASETVMRFVDRLFLSYLGKLHIAAAMSGGLSAFVFSSLFAGIVGYTNAIVAQYYGSGQRYKCVQTVTQGLYLTALFLPLLILLIPVVRGTFHLAGHSPEQIALEFSYFRILMAGSIFLLLRQVLVGYFLGIGKTRVVMLANLVGLLVNVPLNYVLIFGHLGMPALGIEGAAIGTVAASATIFLVLLQQYLRHEFVRRYRGEGAFRLNAPLLRRLFRFGFPAGAELFLNVFAFNAFIQIIHSMGEDVAAAVTITFNYDMVAFIPMIGLGVAVTAMVGQHMGAGDVDGAHKSTLLALRVGYSYALVMMVLFVFGAPLLVRLFAAGMEAGDQELLDLATAMVRLAAIYTLADITQLVFAGALRGAGDTRAVMVISAVMHWIMAVGVVLAVRVFELEPLVIWSFFIGFVVVLGASIFLRYKTGRWRSLSVIRDGAEAELREYASGT